MSVLVRHNGSGTNTTATATWTFTPATGYGAGHQALVAIRGVGSATVNNVTDNLGNTYVQVFTVILSTTIRIALWACYNTAAGTPTISVTFSAALTNKEWDVSEWAGLGNPADVTATNTASTASTSLDSGTTATTTDSGELAVAVYALSGTGVGAATITPATGYTALGDASVATTTRLVTHYHTTGGLATQDAVATSTVTGTQANGIAVFPNVYSPLGPSTLAGSGTLSGVLGAIVPLGTSTLSGQGGLYLIVPTSLGSGTIAGSGTLAGAIGHLGQIVNFIDYCPQSGVTYLYKAVAVTSQGATAESAPLTASATISVGPFLHLLDQPSTLWQFGWDIGAKVQHEQPAVSFLQVEGRQYPLAEYDEDMIQGTFTLNLNCYFDQGVRPWQSSDKNALETLVYGGGTVCYRDRRGRRLFGSLSDYQATDIVGGYTTSVTLTRSDDSDEV